MLKATVGSRRIDVVDQSSLFYPSKALQHRAIYNGDFVAGEEKIP
jgi:hypothetical protein